MAKFEVAAVGDNCVDRYLSPVGLSAIGGNAVNVAVHLRKQGLKTAYFGAVGPDSDGRRMLECFKQNGLNTDHVQVNPGVTAYTNIDIDTSGDRIFSFEEFGVCRTYRPNESDFAVLRKMRHVHIGWLDDGGDLKRRLRDAGVSVSQDIAVNPGADGLAIAFGSAGAHPMKARQIAEGYLAQGASVAVVTLGALGSLATDGSTVVEAGIRPVKVTDTTGAGDTFIAAFIARRLSGEDLVSSLDGASEAASITCTHFGGFPQVPEKL
jgi:fructoselysine 6-kinase